MPPSAERARALAHLAQQPVILLLAVARLGAQLVDAREHLCPEAARLEQRNACGARRARDRADTGGASVNAKYSHERAGEPPARPAEPPAEQQRRRQQRGERGDL